MKAANGHETADSAAVAFTRLLSQYLSQPLSFGQPFDSLSLLVSMLSSADQRIRFFSWEVMPGGSWHYFFSLAQFRDDDGRSVVKPLTTEPSPAAEISDFSDSRIYEVHQLHMAGQTYYLCFAWGTHGGGHQHQLVRLYHIKGQQLLPCHGCLAGQDQLLIKYPRAAKSYLTYHPDTGSISFAEFRFDAQEGIYKTTGRKVILTPTNAVFIKQVLEKDR